MCKNYKICRNRTGAPQRKMCWRMWRLCGDCAVIEHPEAYQETYVKKTISKILGSSNNPNIVINPALVAKIRSENVTAL